MIDRAPSLALAVDANIVVGVVLGLKFRWDFERVSASRALLTSARACEQALDRIAKLADDPEEALSVAADLFRAVTVVGEEVYRSRLDRAADFLRLAVPSRNGSTRDAHLLATAWVYTADIWSHDRGFSGTGWPFWSSANLRASLAAEATA